MTNERLRNAISARGLTSVKLAERVAVDPKTVERWIATDRIPHRTHRGAVASVVGIDEAYLWPTAAGAGQRSVDDNELITMYPTRGAVPSGLWLELVKQATTSIDTLMFAGLFLTDGGPEMSDALARKARNGVLVRVLLGDPDSQAVSLRGQEEGIGSDLAARIRIRERYLCEVARTDGVQLRWHDTTLYNSIYRCDENMLVNTHVYGAPASQNPVLHLRRTPTGKVFENYMTSFDRVWESSISTRGESW